MPAVTRGRLAGILALVLAFTACATTAKRVTSSSGHSALTEQGGPTPTDARVPAASAPGVPGAPGASTPKAAARPSGGRTSAGQPLVTVPGTARPPSRHPGVSDTEVKIGIAIINDGAQIYGALGVKGATSSVAETEAYTQTIFNWINAHGGMAGRRAVPRFFGYSYFTGTFAAQSQAICTHFTEDDPVLAVVSSNTVRNLADCLQKHNTMLIDQGNSEAYDMQTLAELGPHYYRPFQMHLSRLGQQIDGLAGAGFLTTHSKIGVLRWDLPQAARAMQQTVRPALAARGLQLTGEYAYSYVSSISDLSQTSAESSNAVLRFRTAGIDRVVLIASQAVFPLFFGAEAESQGYRPYYGWSSLDVPSSMPGNMPEGQFAGSRGVGWNTQFDLDFNGDQAIEENPQYKQCSALMRAAGQSHPGDGFGCDYFLFLQAGLNRVKDVSPAGFRAALNGMGSAFQSAQSRLSFQSGRYDGIDTVRDFAYDAGCTCFKYTSPPRAA